MEKTTTNEQSTALAIPPERKLWQEHHQAALEAITRLIHTTLTMDDRGRFERAAKISQLALALQREGVVRVGDLSEVDDGLLVDQVPVYAGFPPVVRARAGAPLNDNVQLMRELSMLLQQQTAGNQVSQQARAAEAEANELASLLDSLERLEDKGMPSACVRHRIEQLQKKMKERTHGDGAAEVVPADVLRGHPAGVEGRADEGHLPQARPVGGGGDGAAAPAGDRGEGPYEVVRACRIPEG